MAPAPGDKVYPRLKDALGPEAVQQLSQCLQAVYPPFNQAAFKRAANAQLQQLELKARVHHLIEVLHRYLPEDFEHTAQLLSQLKQQQLEQNLEPIGQQLLLKQHTVVSAREQRESGIVPRQISLDGCTVENVALETNPGLFLAGNLWLPADPPEKIVDSILRRIGGLSCED